MSHNPLAQTKTKPAEELWEAAKRRIPELPPEEQRAGLVLLRELANGEPVDAARLSQVLDVSIDATESLLQDSGLSPFVYADDDGRVLGFWGLATVPTHHRFNVDGRTLWTWCAMDSLFLPGLLDETAQIESEDPESGDLVRLTISPEGIESVEPKQGVVVSINSPKTWEISTAEKVMKTACHFIYFFASRESGEDWVAKHPETVLLPLETAFEYGKRQNARVFGVGPAPDEPPG